MKGDENVERKDNNVADYKDKIFEIVKNINNQDFLKRIYKLAEYLYIHK